MTLHHIRLELAREADAPHGDPRDGYDLVMTLDQQSRLDAAALLAAPERTRVRRFRDGETLAVGQLSQGADGRWVLDFPGESSTPSASASKANASCRGNTSPWPSRAAPCAPIGSPWSSRWIATEPS